MKLITLPSEFQKALPILKKIKEAGYEAYFVGGSVRDVLLNRPIHDVDIATSSYPEETKAIFTRTVDLGIEHGTILVLEGGSEYEITTFRTEDVYVDYRRPSQVSFVRSLEEDLKRRDFTVNALALDEDGAIIDKFSGLDDLKSRRLRAVGKAQDRFEEDALRIMRGFRFAATLNFTVEEKTLRAMAEQAHLLTKISVERIFIEFDKLLMSTHWRRGLELLINAQAYQFLPDLAGQKNNLKKMMTDLQATFNFTESAQAWASLMISLDISNSKAFLKKWKTSNDFQKKVDHIVSLYRLRQKQELDKWSIYSYGKEIALLCEELRHARALEVDFSRIQALDEALAIHDKHEIVINGRYLMQELGIPAGPQLGKLLHQVEKAIVCGWLPNELPAIRKYIIEELRNE
ncbi:poly A polymerase head domain-containing protein [Streptococcus pseudoporcinus]|uniref:CCA-adding enzyme n=1 Tax=Streptococcus pseudoporcinus TaxID=361101 RepID=A0A4U9Y730_9STRE|nr:CCA tRNA nucleotidyltransferase [Streptococcus pseudoporcinus]VTS21929.1 poly A polymerase head domain-containing protein [Streptococcus pseudoporcinus]